MERGLTLGKIEKHIGSVLVFIIVASTFCVLSPLAFGEARALDLRVSNYSWYKSSVTGNFIVVGEVQNFENATVNSASPRGFVYTKDGQLQAAADYAILGFFQAGNMLLPNQKVPLYMEFTAQSSSWLNLSWVDLGIDRVEFSFFGTTTTEEPQDSGLQIRAHTPSVDIYGYYNVTGLIMNRGNLYPEYVWVIATFYNASGTVIAVGASNYITPNFLPPNQSALFSLIPVGSTTQMATQIATYELQVLWSGSTTQLTPSPSASPSASASPSPTSPTVSPTGGVTPSPEPIVSIPLSVLYAIVAAVVVAVVIIVLALVLRRRRKRD